MDSVNSRFKEARKLLGFNQKEFASQLGISQTHVSSIENGKDNPSTALLKLLSVKFGIDEEWVIEGIGSPFPQWDPRDGDKGMLPKYKTMRILFERLLRNRSGEDLANTVEAYSLFVSLLSAKNLNAADTTEYVKSIRLTIDTLEELLFTVSHSKTTMPLKRDVKHWLLLKNSCEKMIGCIDQHIKDAVNLYLVPYGEEMKL